MPPFGRREEDLLKQYGWVLIVAAVLVGLWLTTTEMAFVLRVIAAAAQCLAPNPLVIVRSSCETSSI